jgi:hypothetical protein
MTRAKFVERTRTFSFVGILDERIRRNAAKPEWRARTAGLAATWGLSPD